MRFMTIYTGSIEAQKKIVESTRNNPDAKTIAKNVRVALQALKTQVEFAARQREAKIALVNQLTQGEVDPSILSLGTTITTIKTTDTTNFSKDLAEIAEIDAMAREIIGQSYAGYITAGVVTMAAGLAVYAVPFAMQAARVLNNTAV